VTAVVAMCEIHIKLQRNDELKDWSIEIHGRLHEHVSNEVLTDRVEGALIVAAKSLTQASGNARALQGCAEATVPASEHSGKDGTMAKAMSE
jgi:hypothetical protein